MASDELSAEEIHKLKQFSHALPDEQDKLEQLKNVDIDAIVDATGVSRRNVLQVILGLAAGGVVGGLSAQEIVQAVEADASTTDSDGNVGLPGDRVDVYADGIESNSLSTDSIEDASSGNVYDVDDLFGGAGFENRLSKVRQVAAAPVGHTWEKEATNPVLANTESYESGGISEASVIELSGTFEMYYGADDGTNIAVNRATSSDGINWTRDANNPVISSTSGGDPVGQMSVAYADSTYHMYARNTATDEIHYFTSTDGVNWTDNGVVLSPSASGWDDTALYNTCPIKMGQTWYVWYEATGPDFQIGLAVGSAPDNLSKFNEPVIETSASGFDSGSAYNPSVVYTDGMFYMWYGGNNTTVAQTGLATSTDGVNWTKYRNNPVLPVGSSGSWDDAQAMDPSVIRVGDTFYMWYKGADAMGTTNQQIGLATNDMGVPL